MREAFEVLHHGFARGRRYPHLMVLDSEDRLIGLLGMPILVK